MSPFQALYGHLPSSILAYTRGSTTIPVLEEALLERDKLLCVLKRNLQATQNCMVQQANAHCRDINFSVGDMVLVCLQPYCPISLRQYRQHKLSKKFYGPFAILKCIGSVTYHLQLPDYSRIYPSDFQVSTLKPFKGTANPPHHALPLDSISNKHVEIPLAIVVTRTVLMHMVLKSQTIGPCSMVWLPS
jgi:hypothetical protein